MAATSTVYAPVDGTPPRPVLVDVIIPVLNGEGTVADAVRSIQRQTIADLRIIVVDDGSTDGTRAILDTIAAEDPRVVVVCKPNGGIVDALNLGLAQGSAEIVARHDADDVAWPERFERQLAYLAANPDCVAVSAWVQFMDAGGQVMEGRAMHPPPNGDPTLAPAREPFLMHPMLMARRSSVAQVGGYRHVFHAEDSDLYWRLSEIGRLHILPEVLGYYRLHDASVTSRSVVNGRVGAITSQLAAVSTLRRRQGRPELAFPPSALAGYERAATLRGMHGLAAATLEPAERARFEIATAAKMLRLAEMRPYELEPTDCLFIRRAVHRHLHLLAHDNASALKFQLVETARRLRRKGHAGRAVALTPFRLYPTLLKALVWPRLQRRLAWRREGGAASPSQLRDESRSLRRSDAPLGLSRKPRHRASSG